MLFRKVNGLFLCVVVSLYGCGGGSGSGGEGTSNNLTEGFSYSKDSSLAEYDRAYFEKDRQVDVENINGTWLSVSSFIQYSIENDDEILVNPVIEIDVYSIKEDADGAGITMTDCWNTGASQYQVYLESSGGKYMHPNYYKQPTWPITFFENGVIEYAEYLSSEVSVEENIFQERVNVRLYKLSDDQDAIMGVGTINNESIAATCYSGEMGTNRRINGETLVGTNTPTAFSYFGVIYKFNNGDAEFISLRNDGLTLTGNPDLPIESFLEKNTLLNDGDLEIDIYQPGLFDLEVGVLDNGRVMTVNVQL